MSKTTETSVELVNNNTGEISIRKAITDPFALADTYLEVNPNMAASIESFNFNDLEVKLRENPLYVKDMQDEIDEIKLKYTSEDGVFDRNGVSRKDEDRVSVLVKEIQLYFRPRVQIIEIGENMYTHDEKEPKRLTKYFLFKDWDLGGQVRVMRQKMAITGVDYINEMFFNQLKGIEGNAFGVTKDSVFDRNTVYSNNMFVGVLFLGAVEKPNQNKYHAIEIKLYNPTKS